MFSNKIKIGMCYENGCGNKLKLKAIRKDEYSLKGEMETVNGNMRTIDIYRIKNKKEFHIIPNFQFTQAQEIEKLYKKVDEVQQKLNELEYSQKIKEKKKK